MRQINRLDTNSDRTTAPVSSDGRRSFRGPDLIRAPALVDPRLSRHLRLAGRDGPPPAQQEERIVSRVSKIALFSALVAAAVTTSESSSARQRHGGNAGRVAAIIQQMDADHNGRISKEEFMQYMSAEFDRIDRDRSGELTSEEISRSSLLTGGGIHTSPHR
jgi:uncharacterized membrane protein